MKNNLSIQSVALICGVLLTFACSSQPPITPTATPEITGNAQIDAIQRIRMILGMPNLPLEWTGMEPMINSPSGSLPVEIYSDNLGRKFSVEPASNTVVEIDARNLLASIPTGAPSLSQDELRARALKIAKATIPNFDSMVPSLIDDSGGKINNYFFDLRKPPAPNEMMPPFFQIGFDKSGLIFAYINTLSLK